MSENPGSRGRRWLLPLLVALLVALLSATALQLADDGDDPDPAGAVVAAQRAATTFFTLDHATIEEDVERMLTLATGDFRDEYAAQSDTLVDRVREGQLVVSADLAPSGTAVEHLTGDRAQILVAVDATTTLPDQSTEETRYRTRIRLELVDERWLVAGVEEVG